MKPEHVSDMLNTLKPKSTGLSTEFYKVDFYEKVRWMGIEALELSKINFINMNYIKIIFKPEEEYLRLRSTNQ